MTYANMIQKGKIEEINLNNNLHRNKDLNYTEVPLQILPLSKKRNSWSHVVLAMRPYSSNPTAAGGSVNQ